MGKIYRILSGNKLYAVLLAFILLVNVAALLYNRSDAVKTGETAVAVDAAGDEKPDGEGSFLSSPDREAQEKKLEELMRKNPGAYLFIIFFELGILFVIFLGFVLDGYLITWRLKKKAFDLRLTEIPSPAWAVGDVIRVVIIFLSFGYAFALLEGAFVGYIPILKNENFNMIFTSGVMNIGAIAVILYFVVKKYGQSVKALGISFKNALSGMFIGLAGYVAVVPAILTVMVLTVLFIRLIKYEPPVQPIVEVFMKEKGNAVLGFSALFASVLGPVSEEIFFRGFMYGVFKKRIGIVKAMLITSALFAMLHAHLVGFLPIFILGLLLAYLYERTGSIIPSVTVHVIHNVGTLVTVFIAKYING